MNIAAALIGLGISTAGIGFLFYRHWHDGEEEAANFPFFFEEFFIAAKTRVMVFWQQHLRDYVFHGSEIMLAYGEGTLKRIAAFLRLLRSRVRRRQINGAQEDRYWHNLNSWNARRLKIRLSRRKKSEEHTELPA